MEIYGRKCGSNCNISTRCWIGARTSGNLIKLADEPFDGTPSVNTLGKVIDFMTNDLLESIYLFVPAGARIFWREDAGLHYKLHPLEAAAVHAPEI